MKVVFVDESTLTLDDVDFSCLGQFLQRHFSVGRATGVGQ
jgi:hypothetical protein